MTNKKLILRFGKNVDVVIYLNTVTLYRGSENPTPPFNTTTTGTDSASQNVYKEDYLKPVLGEGWSAISIIPVSNVGNQYIKNTADRITEYKRDQDKKEVRWQIDIRKIIPQATQVIMMAAKQLRDSPDLSELVIDIEQISKDLSRFHREFANEIVKECRRLQFGECESEENSSQFISDAEEKAEHEDEDTLSPIETEG